MNYVEGMAVVYSINDRPYCFFRLCLWI